MSITTMTPVRIESVAPFTEQSYAMKELRDGLSNAIAALGIPALDVAYDAASDDAADRSLEPDAAKPWEHLMDEAIEDVIGEVASIVDAAIANRLPWQWP